MRAYLGVSRSLPQAKGRLHRRARRLRRLGPLVLIASLTATGPAAEAATYHVRRGDTLTTLARRWGVSLAELAALNDITNTDRVMAVGG